MFCSSVVLRLIVVHPARVHSSNLGRTETDRGLKKDVSNIPMYIRRFGDQPGRPRAHAPFRVRQHFGPGPETRLSVVRQHILRAVDHIQSTDSLEASGSGARPVSSRQGVD
jgi:hypothetical protein